MIDLLNLRNIKLLPCTLMTFFIVLILQNYLYADISIRANHPRLFFNSDSIDEVREKAINEENEYYNYIKSMVDSLLKIEQKNELKIADYGHQSAWAAFVYLVEGEERYLNLSQKCIENSLDYYEQCFENRVSVNWRAHTRAHVIMALDWIYNDLSEIQRSQTISRIIQYVDDLVNKNHHISREHPSDFKSGMYGYRSLLWYASLLAYGEGIESSKIEDWFIESKNEHLKMLNYRSSKAGDDGGGATASIDYIACWYPYAEWNFYYTMLSSMGKDIINRLEHNHLLPNYVFWNCLPSSDIYRSYGFGDASHSGGNLLWANQFLYTNLSVIEDLLGEKYPQTKMLSEHIKNGLNDKWKKWRNDYFIYPFLLKNLDNKAYTILNTNLLPTARYFENQGQLFMSSGFGKSDVYCMITCSGGGLNHAHYDALHFTIYTDDSFLAIDSGDRFLAEKENLSMAHLVNYYSQSVAHNTILVNQPNEPKTKYWGKDASIIDGGQHGSNGVIKAFEQNNEYVYVAADATKTYFHNSKAIPEKVNLVTRQMVYLPPRHFVIYDRVISTKADYTKRWLLHTIGEPQINKKTFYADHNDNRLFCRNLLPNNVKITKIGGEGKEFWSAGQNWPLAKGDNPEEFFDEAGRWRIEIKPSMSQKEDAFLNILEVSKTDKFRMTDVKPIELANLNGVELIIDDNVWRVCFNKSGRLGGNIICEQKGISAELPNSVQHQEGIFNHER